MIIATVSFTSPDMKNITARVQNMICESCRTRRNGVVKGEDCGTMVSDDGYSNPPSEGRFDGGGGGESASGESTIY